jgi:hypothetical protein
VASGEWRVASLRVCEWRVGEWRVASLRVGEWRVASGEWRVCEWASGFFDLTKFVQYTILPYSIVRIDCSCDQLTTDN